MFGTLRRMLARVQSFLLAGIDALPCEVEIDHNELGLNNADNKPTLVGLPDASVKESVERVRAAITNSGFGFPDGRLVINLAPADVRKEGPMYDLPMAIGLLACQRVVPTSTVSGRAVHGSSSAAVAAEFAPESLDYRSAMFVGELALDGRLRPVRGVLAMAALAAERGFRAVVVPAENAAEAAIVAEVEVYAVRTLSEVVGLLRGELPLEPHPPADVAAMLMQAEAPIDFAEVRGQEAVKRAITIAAAGSHNLLMLGPAGSGKTMMAKALPGVLPPLTPQEAVEITRIWSAAGALKAGQGLVTHRPVRTPHHTSSAAAVVGGGMIPKAGEVSLAHRGVLFLDEMAEFPRDVLETLRQPMEDHVVTISRAKASVKFPASFMLVGAMNPTPRGDVAPGDVGRREMSRYLAKLSGPLLDRIDIHVEAPAVPFNQLRAEARGTTSEAMRRDAARARERAAARQGQARPNARLSGKELDRHARLTPQAEAVLGAAITELGLSARAYDKVRRVALTIADLDSAPATPRPADAPIDVHHIAEAVSYRLLDRKL